MFGMTPRQVNDESILMFQWTIYLNYLREQAVLLYQYILKKTHIIGVYLIYLLMINFCYYSL